MPTWPSRSRFAGLDGVFADCSPEEKLAVVRSESAGTSTTAMVGDGINDAPALAAADLGVALGARGATAPSEAADVVLVVDRLDRLATGMRVARRARGIARQSVVVGMGLSFTAMGFAAFGLTPPVAGAILQEGIDVAVIVNALRVLRSPSEATSGRIPEQWARQLHGGHAELLPVLDEIRLVADQLDSLGATAVAPAAGHGHRAPRSRRARAHRRARHLSRRGGLPRRRRPWPR